MKNYKLREGENSRKPSVKRDIIEIRVPVLLLCLAMAFLVWLYIVSISKIDPADPLETQPDTTEETVSAIVEPVATREVVSAPAPIPTDTVGEVLL